MEEKTLEASIKKSFSAHYRLPLMIIVSVFLALILVLVSMILYKVNGASQLDLSRPGYVNVRSKTIDNTVEFKNYSETGLVDQAAIDEFKNLYDEQAGKIKLADAFKSDPLSPDELGISSETVQQ